ncbi:MAG: hypothetical protein CMK46_00675 [Porticoccus sp.]|nr:hypothetical protein [Porticoccus sp.]|tara:strand:- start:24609 stop:25583 length:975 start_codon:yes stop_codon:yes gene_type:complete
MYKIRFPFRLAPGQDLTECNEKKMVGSLSISIGKESGFHCLHIEGFETQKQAVRFYEKIDIGFKYITLNTGLSFLSVGELQKVNYAENPHEARKSLSKSLNITIEEPVDALIDGARPAIYLTEKSIRKITAGSITTTESCLSENFLELFAKSAMFETPDAIRNDGKLLSALDLYSGHFLETTPRAKFLTLVMAIETIVIPTPRTDNVLALINRWKKEAEEELKALDSNSDEYFSLESLRNELLFRRDDSIRRRIKNYIFNLVRSNKDDDAEQVSADAVRVYDFRSRLVHGGRVNEIELSENLSVAKKVVENVLTYRFEGAVGVG